MTRIFYVDLDALQGVLAGLAQAEAGHPPRRSTRG